MVEKTLIEDIDEKIITTALERLVKGEDCALPVRLMPRDADLGRYYPYCNQYVKCEGKVIPIYVWVKQVDIKLELSWFLDPMDVPGSIILQRFFDKLLFIGFLYRELSSINKNYYEAYQKFKGLYNKPLKNILL